MKALMTQQCNVDNPNSVNENKRKRVVYIEPEIHEDEIIQETESQFQIIQAVRIKKYTELVNTHFAKITFESENLPEYITFNYVRIPVEEYQIPIKQCYRCFAYGHVANSHAEIIDYAETALSHFMRDPVTETNIADIATVITVVTINNVRNTKDRKTLSIECLTTKRTASQLPNSSLLLINFKKV